MNSPSDRTLMRLGGAGALAAMALSTVLVLAQLTAFRELYNLARRVSTTAFAEYWGLSVLESVGVVLAVLAADRMLRPTNRVLRAGLVAGVAAAAMMFGGALASIAAGQRGGAAPLVAELSAVPLGVWVLCLVATDWRLRRLHSWLRLVGAVFGAALMVLPAIPVLRLLMVLAIPWWIGLGVVFLRAPRPLDGPPRVNARGAPWPLP